MQEACARFERFLKQRHGQRSTPVHYISDLRIFIATIDKREPEAITTADIDTFIQQQLALGRSPTTSIGVCQLFTLSLSF